MGNGPSQLLSSRRANPAAALVAAPGIHHQWSRHAIQFRDDPQDISEPLINDSCVAPSGTDCRSITSSNTLPGVAGPVLGPFSL
jgi:hypothetical protein